MFFPLPLLFLPPSTQPIPPSHSLPPFPLLLSPPPPPLLFPLSFVSRFFIDTQPSPGMGRGSSAGMSMPVSQEDKAKINQRIDRFGKQGTSEGKSRKKLSIDEMVKSVVSCSLLFLARNTCNLCCAQSQSVYMRTILKILSVVVLHSK